MECEVYREECGVWSLECGVWSAAPATQNYDRQRSPKCCGCHENCTSSCENDAEVLRLSYKTTFDTFSNRLTIGMSKSAAPATQNDMTTCLETFEKERFCSLPHRHGEATGKPETRDETQRAFSARLSSNFDTL